jgi:hypothetical protein
MLQISVKVSYCEYTFKFDLHFPNLDQHYNILQVQHTVEVT